jgi:endoglucanase
MDDLEILLKQLTEVSGVAGYEREVCEVIKPYFQQFGEITKDKLGSLICKKTGGSQNPKLALAAHMDEIGFMVKHITKEGFIKFTSLGGWWDQVLLAQRVFIKTHKGDVVGGIGAKPPHLLSDEECKKVVEKKDMYIDIGATSKEEVEEVGVRLGDPIIPISSFTKMANGKTYLAKALDDRAGCALAIFTMQKLANINHPNTVFAVATTQEEIGARGATTSVELIDPDLAIILEVDIAGDVPEIKPEESSIKLGGGPTLLTYDVRMIPNLKLRDLVVDTAKEKDIPLQLSAQEDGSTDGGPIHLHKIGVPTVVISVPTRHIHSHGAIIHRQDFDRTVDLVTAIVERLDSKTVRELTL